MPANNHIVKKKCRPPTTVLGGQSGTPGAHYSRQWAHLGRFNAALYVATGDGKISRAPTEYKWLQEKQQDSQETDTKAKKGELIQNKNSDDAMVVLF